MKFTAPDGPTFYRVGYSVAVDANTDTVFAGSLSNAAYSFELSGWLPIPDSGHGEVNTTSYTVSGLTNGLEYAYRIRAVNDTGEGQASDMATATPGTDYDIDNNGLIDVSNLAQLNAIRWDLDGDGSSTDPGYRASFPDAFADMGCADSGCRGYELATGLDFDTDGSGSVDANDDYWNEGRGWLPIGDFDSATRFSTTFEGNGHTVASLFISRGTVYQGLFGYIDPSGEVRNLALTGVAITSGNRSGGPAGYNKGQITGSYATGSITGGEIIGGLVGYNSGSIDRSYSQATVDGVYTLGGLVGWNNGTVSSSYAVAMVNPGGENVDNVGGLAGYNDGAIDTSYSVGRVSAVDNVGGLVGWNDGSIKASYSASSVSGNEDVGGLVGDDGRGSIVASYSVGQVSGVKRDGGLVGRHFLGTTTDSYWDTDRSGQTESAGGTGKTTTDLKTPTGYEGIYANWDLDLNGVEGGEDPWDFGDSDGYPLLKVDFDGDDSAAWYEFGNQHDRIRVTISADNLAPVLGDRVKMTAEVVNPPDGNPRYQWQRQLSSGWRNVSNNRKTASVKFDSAGTRTYRVKVTYSGRDPVTSQPISLTWRSEASS